MRWAAGLLVLCFMGTALAGDPLAAPSAAKPDIERVWALEDTVSRRFPEGDTPGPTFGKDEELEVLWRDSDRIRVRRGTRFGWVLPGQVTSKAPALSTDDVDLQQLLESLGQDGEPPEED
jgi:hypothetical protein